MCSVNTLCNRAFFFLAFNKLKYQTQVLTASHPAVQLRGHFKLLQSSRKIILTLMLKSRNHNAVVYILIEVLSLRIKIINFVCFLARNDGGAV